MDNMESKSVENYFNKAKQIPIAVSLTDIKSIISAKGVTSPPKKSWWNLNNIIIMTTTTLLTTAILLFTLPMDNSMESTYIPIEKSYAIEIKEEAQLEHMKFVVAKEDSTEEEKKVKEELFPEPSNEEAIIEPYRIGSHKTITISEDANIARASILDVTIENGLVEAPTLFEEDFENDAVEETEGIFEIEMEEEELFESGIELTEQVDGETRTVTAVRDINGLNTLFLKNKNGDITVNTWEEAKIKVTAYFTLETKDPEDAKIGLDDFSISITEQGGKAAVQSNWDNLNNCSCNASNGSTRSFKGIGKLLYFPSKNKAQTDDGVDFEYEKFKIEYIVYIPKDFHVDLSNQYADIHLASVNGNADISIFHGDLEAKNVENLSLQSKYGKAEVGDVKDAEVVLFHSDAKVGVSNEMDLTAKYSTVEIGELTELNLVGFQSKLKIEGAVKKEIEGSFKYGGLTIEGDVKEIEILLFQSDMKAENIAELNLNASYSKLKAERVDDLELEKAFQSNFKIEEIGEVEGALKYSPMNIGKLDKSLDLTTFQGNLEIKEIQADFSSMSLNTKYTNVDLKFSPEAKYDLDVETTYTDLKLPTGIENSQREEPNGNQHHFIGTYNKESNKEASKIFMKSFQGNVTLY